MNIMRLTSENEYWDQTIKLAEQCTWSAGPNLAKRMKENDFYDFECPFAAVENNQVIGFCVITKTDYIPDCAYTPWIGFVFVAEQARGKRVSQKMVEAVLAYAKTKGFEKIYVCTEEEGLYEKYGFVQIDSLKSYDDTMETIFVYDLSF